MDQAQWETLRASVTKMRDNAERFAGSSCLDEVSMGYHAQVEVLQIVLDEMVTIEQATPERVATGWRPVAQETVEGLSYSELASLKHALELDQQHGADPGYCEASLRTVDREMARR